MSRAVNSLMLAILTLGVLLAGCDGVREKETEGGTGVEESQANAAATFDCGRRAVFEPTRRPTRVRETLVQETQSLRGGVLHLPP